MTTYALTSLQPSAPHEQFGNTVKLSHRCNQPPSLVSLRRIICLNNFVMQVAY